MAFARILVVDAAGAERDALVAALRDGGHMAAVTDVAGELLRLVGTGEYDLLLLGHALPGADPVELLRQAKSVSPSTLIVMTGRASSPDAVIAGFRAGAYDFLTDSSDGSAVRELATRARTLREKGEKRRRLSEELEQERLRVLELKGRLAFDDPFEKIIGSSLAMRNLAETLREIARTDSTVLLRGESGTGKGLAARAIHEASVRRENPFVEANCVVYSEGVLHSELFGHEKGAFTGAAKQKRGRFEMAHTGTLFLDEIGEISPATQLLLLRVLQERTFERVGGEETLEADVRLIAATNGDLEEAIRRSEFRSDLYYRLNVIPVRLPALREHPEDIPVLAQHFVRRCSARLGRDVEVFSDEAMQALMRHAWPGNVRELENMIERLVVLCRGQSIEWQDLPEDLRNGGGTGGGLMLGTLQEMERRRIAEVLHETGGNKKLAAERLGIHRSTLYAKLKRHGLLEPAACPDTRQDASESPTGVAMHRATGT